MPDKAQVTATPKTQMELSPEEIIKNPDHQQTIIKQTEAREITFNLYQKSLIDFKFKEYVENLPLKRERNKALLDGIIAINSAQLRHFYIKLIQEKFPPTYDLIKSLEKSPKNRIHLMELKKKEEMLKRYRAELYYREKETPRNNVEELNKKSNKVNEKLGNTVVPTSETEPRKSTALHRSSREQSLTLLCDSRMSTPFSYKVLNESKCDESDSVFSEDYQSSDYDSEIEDLTNYET
ncbi:hypothetical protein Btru_062801 [Bulinus truncatus]|nr:hypothetical protein Btru_062801 [Bulinus truncatus]